MYILTPNLNGSLIVFSKWETVIEEAEKMVVYFYQCGYGIELQNFSKEKCDVSGITCYAIYNYDYKINIERVIVK